MGGWIKLHRKMLNSFFYKNLTSKQRDVIITLLLMADHEPKEWFYRGKKYRTEPGQIFTSAKKIAENCGRDCTRASVYATLLKAEQNNFITQSTNSSNTLITIVNWELYQSLTINDKQYTNNLQTEQNRFSNTNKKKEERIYNIDSKEYILSSLLLEKIRTNNHKFKEPNLNTWCSEMDKILRIDKRPPEDIEAVIRWCQEDDFWHKNILSPSKLRKQFDKLYMQMPKNKVVNFPDLEIGIGKIEKF